MRISKNLPENLEELGALLSLFPREWRRDKMANWAEGREPPQRKYPKQTVDGIKTRLMSKVEKDERSQCWNWTGAVRKNGYGAMYCLFQNLLVHRISWAIHKGVIPEDLCVLHHCDNRRCVNPDHLFLGTNQDNQDDCRRKNRHRWLRGDELPMAKLTKNDVLKIRKRRNRGVVGRVIAKDFNVTMSAIYSACNGKSWKWL